MSKKDKNKVLIVFLYFLSLLIFDLVFINKQFDGDIRKMLRGNCDVFKLLASFADAGVYHFIFISFIYIVVKFIKKIDIEYKDIIRWFPLCTFTLALPMSIPTAIIVRIHLYIFGFYN